MHRLLVRACQDQTRRWRRVAVEVREIDLDRPDPADPFSGVAQRDEIERAFVQLPVDHLAVLVLTHYVGLSAAEVGQVLGIPTGTVYSRLHYGSRMMRIALTHSASVTLANAPEQI